ncbi:Gluconate 2-dehydrogenase flavoprotein precursor [Jeotgalicoccus aerolatus]|uniref:Gluconate 2-dehydrogenase alpha chain n=1 Tax=Jeotgalicoccus aerolatus TaxID=709510 RepID=A0ABS4HK46_9STAP|nr:GMC family oxidoreductase [Jeotgalicoccus aerolatus]MBP1951295.1 gluconate 2-dehydrogenase alpha chain [Jeotgalicoccus aerolatus]GGD98604.1 GMC family oxidoreductase [Jeotgalicoccus aerolatus]CAD2077264.1 Gluconate 2-dehydrogenase flavoprotein precursor [Jeotgalicoccus aerolatus]
MVTTLDKVDVVTVGVGWTGGIIAAEATKAGLSVMGLERGKKRGTEDYQHVHDELKYAVRYELMQDIAKETMTFRNSREQDALPMRQQGSFLLGENLGGAGTHWNGQTWRFLPYDFEVKSMTEERYGSDKLQEDDGYRWEDWGITYDELEPYFNTFEQTAGISGEDNPLGGDRSESYPTPPMLKSRSLRMFEEAATNMELHPIMMPSANLSQQYENPDGETINACQYCAFCERFACEYDAKATPEVTVIKTAQKSDLFQLRVGANVVEIITDEDDDSKVSGVKFVDVMTGEEFIQPADIVALTSYIFNNYKLLAVSDIGEQYDPETEEGTLGRNYCYQIFGGATGFFDEQFNTFMGAGSLGMALDDYNGDNFDHEDLDFLHGGNISITQTGARPILNNPVPSDTPSWGEEFKEESIKNYTRVLSVSGQGATSPHKENYLSMDTEYTDAYGVPLVCLTYNFTDQDRARQKYLAERSGEILEEMGASQVDLDAELTDYNIAPYQSTHNTGGTTMGASPETSVVNNYLQHWDRDNLFVVGAGNFQHNSGYNPTATVGALAYRCADGIIKYAEDNRRLEEE